MKAVVYHGPSDIRIDSVSDPKLQQRNDAIIRITASAICGTDLHFVRGTVSGMKSGTVLGHEALVQNGTIDPSDVLTQTEPLMNAIDAYKAFDTRSPGWIKVELEPSKVS